MRVGGGLDSGIGDASASEPISSAPLRRDPHAWHVVLLVSLSSIWEALFLRNGINVLDEGWALYAGMQLHMGRTLYTEICWVFPPGHALPAWLGYAFDPGGVLIPRVIYAAFNVALVVALYELGRRLMPPRYALLGAALLAIAAPRSHMMHLLYGYRYSLSVVLVLLAFSRRLDTRKRVWMLMAGALGGVSLFIRVTPALAVSCGIGVAVLSTSRFWRSWLRDWLLYSGGLIAVMAPVLAWFEMSVGLERVWREVIVHPVAMLQPLPVPDLFVPDAWTRDTITEAWRPLALRVFSLLYVGYLVALLISWARSLVQRRPFAHSLLLAVVVWGAVFFLRSFGRADEAHMDTTLPPICLLLGHFVSVCAARVQGREETESPRLRRFAIAVCLAAFGLWVFLSGSDLYSRPERFQGRGTPVKVTQSLALIERYSKPGDVMLDLTAAPMFHALSGRPGPGWNDVVMEGTFMEPGEEEAFVARLDTSPPALVLWPVRNFDDMESRSIQSVAPLVSRWVQQRYVPIATGPKFTLMLPRGRNS